MIYNQLTNSKYKRNEGLNKIGLANHRVTGKLTSCKNYEKNILSMTVKWYLYQLFIALRDL